MTLLQLGALRFSGLFVDFGSLPVDSTLIGATFDAVDTVQKWMFDGTAWVEFPQAVGEDNLGANVGAGTGLVFRDKTGVTLNFKSLIGGTNITVTNNLDDITISSTGTSPLTQKGDIYGFSTADDRIPVGTDGQVLSANSVIGVGVEWIDNFISPLSVQGDIMIFSGGNDIRLFVGTEGQVLTSISGLPNWQTPSAGSEISQGDSSVTVSDLGTGEIQIVADSIPIVDFNNGIGIVAQKNLDMNANFILDVAELTLSNISATLDINGGNIVNAGDMTFLDADSVLTMAGQDTLLTMKGDDFQLFMETGFNPLIFMANFGSMQSIDYLGFAAGQFIDATNFGLDYLAGNGDGHYFAVDGTYEMLIYGGTVEIGNTLAHLGPSAGFFGHAAVSQQVVANGAAVAEVITALKNLGLFV